ncbi:RcnB family protein [Povalibacter sp.]|uniref:RcnB family protein n=1 Tax=Povalibacter sp. TaxID=1962978 RepID=UPI002F40C870
MKRLLVAALAASTLMGTVAMADSHGRDRAHHGHARSDRHDDRRQANDRGRHGHHHDRHEGRGDGRYQVVRYAPPKGHRHNTWHRGARLPAAYYAPRYVIHNYDTYRLRPPPRGHHWVRVDNDVVLAAITTGVVMQVVNGLFY